MTLNPERVAVVLHTSEDRGDHAADIAVWYDLKPEETVLEVVERLLTHQQTKNKYGRPAYHHRMRPENGDYITIRVRVDRS